MLLFPEHQPAAHILRVKTQRLTDIVKGKHPIAARRCDPLLGFVEQPLVFAALRKQIVLEANDRIFQNRQQELLLRLKLSFPAQRVKVLGRQQRVRLKKRADPFVAPMSGYILPVS